MHGKGPQPDPEKSAEQKMRATDNQIQEKYLERAIRELNLLTREFQGCESCDRGNSMPVLGSGHPQADVFLLKHSPSAAEVEEGVAFYGRSGNAITKSLKRLGVDPLAIYGTLCVKCPVDDPSKAGRECVDRLLEELNIIEPKLIIVMGRPALETLNALAVPLSEPIDPRPGEIQQFTPAMNALFTPNIDESLDSDESKRDFWRAFRSLGRWYEDLPPY